VFIVCCICHLNDLEQGAATPCSVKISIDLLIVSREIYKRVSTGMGGRFEPEYAVFP